MTLGRLDDAIKLCQRAVQTAPKDAQANYVMANILLRQGQTVRALHYAGQAAVLSGQHPDAVTLHARLLVMERKPDQAKVLLERLLIQEPGYVPARVELAGIFAVESQFTRAAAVCEAGLALAPRDPGLNATYAGAILNLGRIEQVVPLVERLLEADPENQTLSSGLCLMLNYLPGATDEAIRSALSRYAAILDRAQPPMPVQYTNEPDPQRLLRVGIVSPDLRRHSVAHFIEPFMQHHDRSRIELVVYYTNRVQDDVTARLTNHAAVWRTMDNITDLGLAQAIHADKVDVLIELSGHTHAHSLAAMHLRPAPVQATYLGYPASTGLSQIDYRLTDRTADPPGAEAMHAERLAYIDPCFLCYRPPHDAPEVTPLPRDSNGFITFGSFNSAQKLNKPLIDLWSRVLAAVPGSRLVLKNMNFTDEPLRMQIVGAFASSGIAPARLDIRKPEKDTRSHLSAYADIDIALDPHPYNGTTTTCEALWMGVPVITLAGERHAARVGTSLLASCGLQQCIAPSLDYYLAAAASLASDPQSLRVLRSGLRDRVRACSWMNETEHCRTMEALIRSMWARWCADTLHQ